VKLHPILMPVSEYNHSEKGDALYGKILSLFSHVIILDGVRGRKDTRYGSKDKDRLNWVNLIHSHSKARMPQGSLRTHWLIYFE
jgi:hypothetical protein